MAEQAVLDRGYAMELDASGSLIKRAADVAPGVAMTLRFADGPYEVHRNAIAKLELARYAIDLRGIAQARLLEDRLRRERGIGDGELAAHIALRQGRLHDVLMALDAAGTPRRGHWFHANMLAGTARFGLADAAGRFKRCLDLAEFGLDLLRREHRSGPRRADGPR